MALAEIAQSGSDVTAPMMLASRPERKRQTSPGVAVAGSPKIALLERMLEASVS
jgi:hypothetical protein